MFTRGLARDGERAARRVVLDDTRRVDPVRGRVVDYLRCWYDDFQYGDVAGASVPVKLVVADCSVVFAYVRGRWDLGPERPRRPLGVCAVENDATIG